MSGEWFDMDRDDGTMSSGGTGESGVGDRSLPCSFCNKAGQPSIQCSIEIVFVSLLAQIKYLLRY